MERLTGVNDERSVEPPAAASRSLAHAGTRKAEETEEAAARQALSHTMSALHGRGWCEATGGNFSCLVERTPLRLLMAPSGVEKGSVRPEELIVVNGDGTVVAGDGRASAETLLHLAIIETTGAGAVLHTHSHAATLLSNRAVTGSAALGHVEVEGLEMLKALEGIHTHACRVRIPVLANDQDLSRLSRAARPHLAEAPRGLLIAGHGLYAWGRDLGSARRHLEGWEFLLEQKWRQTLLQALEGHGAKP